MSAAEDQASVEEVLAGNIASFEAIVLRWQRPLVNLAYRFSRDRGRAEEMAQEAFLRAYRSLGQWRRESPFSTWLFALATRLYCTELRRVPLNTVGFDSAMQLRDPQSFVREMEEDERARAVRRAVDALPPKYREVLILFYFHEMDIGAAAESLGMPEGTMKARLFRARELLRNKLGASGEGL